MPAAWPKINLNEIDNKNYEEIALQIISPYLKQTLSDEHLKKIINQTYKNFRKKNIAPLVKIDNNKQLHSSLVTPIPCVQKALTTGHPV